METSDPVVWLRPRTDPFEMDMAQVDAAVELVRLGAALRVRLAGLRDPEALAQVALARTQAADLEFSVDRDGDAVTLTIGPRRDKPEWSSDRP
jgi:predicted RNA polymerase sigma factor